MNNSLNKLRNKINEIDQQILSLITTRADILGDILAAKIDNTSAGNITVFDPQRETAIIRQLVAQNSSVLPGTDIASIFQSIMSACRNWQIGKIDNAEKFHVSIQGAKGSYSEQAILQYCQEKSMAHYKINYAVNSENVLRNISSKKTNYGLVALNNSQGGLVKETIEALSKNKYLIIACELLLVEHSLLALPGSNEQQIKKIYSHPQALKQCHEYLQHNFPNCQLLPWADTALAAADLIGGKLPQDSAVIAHSHCADINKLIILDKDIQDLGRNNETLFLLITGPKNAT